MAINSFDGDVRGTRLAAGSAAPDATGMARPGGRIASLIETAKINGVEPFAYLKATLEAIAAIGHPQSGIGDLLPWNFQPSR